MIVEFLAPCRSRQRQEWTQWHALYSCGKFVFTAPIKTCRLYHVLLTQLRTVSAHGV